MLRRGRRKYPDPMTAYGEIHRGLQVEQLLEKAFADPKQSTSLQSALDQSSGKEDSEEGRISVREAITQFFAQFKWEALSENEQLSVLDRCGKYFPTVNILTGKTQEWKRKATQSSSDKSTARGSRSSPPPGSFSQHGR